MSIFVAAGKDATNSYEMDSDQFEVVGTIIDIKAAQLGVKEVDGGLANTVYGGVAISPFDGGNAYSF